MSPCVIHTQAFQHRRCGIMAYRVKVLPSCLHERVLTVNVIHVSKISFEITGDGTNLSIFCAHVCLEKGQEKLNMQSLAIIDDIFNNDECQDNRFVSFECTNIQIMASLSVLMVKNRTIYIRIDLK